MLQIYTRALMLNCDFNKVALHIFRTQQNIFTEAATWGLHLEKLFLEILQNSPENTSARVSFLIKLQTSGLQLY